VNKIRDIRQDTNTFIENLNMYTMVALTSVVILVVIILYFSAQPVEKAPVVQAPVVKTQVQAPTVEDEILALEQIGANLIISKINEKSDKKVSLKLDKEGWNAGVTDGKKGDYKIKFGHDMHGYSAKVVDKVDKININMEKM
jgi:hypothetical protein